MIGWAKGSKRRRVSKIRRILTVSAFALIATGCGEAEIDTNELVIGISQFPEGFHPNLFAHVAQSLILGATRRPFTVYDSNWETICLLCTVLPSVENGTARHWVSPEGKDGWELDYEIRSDAVWGETGGDFGIDRAD